MVQRLSQHVNSHRNHITGISAALIMVGFALGLLGYPSYKETALLAATVIAALPIALKALQALQMKAFSIELLVTIAVIGALYIREYTESAVVTFLFLFGAYLEARTLEKTRSSLKALLEMAPQEATVIREGESVTVPVDDVVKGDRVVIRSGGKVPVDGRIISGRATLNEAAVTGESVPAQKGVDDRVFSGTLVDTGYIEMVAERVGDDTTFARIIDLVEEAQEAKSKAQKFLDSFATVYTPAVALLSIIVFALSRDLHLAITFLVVACPGALVIGAPVSNVAGIGNGARHGVLVKGGEVMDRLSRVDTVVFDKTGTLTRGRPSVTEIKSFDGRDETELLKVVAEAETLSEHHLGQTIVREARARKLDLNADSVAGEVIKGSGVRATVHGKRLAIGNRKLMDAEGIAVPAAVSEHALSREKAGNTAILAAVDGKVAGIVSIADQIRDDARQAISEMRRNGIERFIMLTGDNRHTAELVAAELGLDEFHAELLPENKVEIVSRLQREGHVVAMAGDGINDAPAIATADIGLAMGEGGTDVSMETADVVLMADKLMQFSHAYSLAKATVSNMKQNSYFAVAIVFVLLAGVLTDNVHLASGMFIHEASVLIVILNAMRLIRFGDRKAASGAISGKSIQYQSTTAN